MKTEGLDGYTAVRMFLEDKCGAIQIEPDGSVWSHDKDFIRLSCLRTNTFRLIDPVIPMEEVKVECWKWNPQYPRPVSCPEVSTLPPVEREKDKWIHLTGTYLRPIPEPEPEEEWKGVIAEANGHWLKIYLENAIDGYEDKPVKVRVVEGKEERR